MKSKLMSTTGQVTAIKGEERGRKIFGAANIKRHLETQKRDHGRDAHTSIADREHDNSREAARRLRQEARRAEKSSLREGRCVAVYGRAGCGKTRNRDVICRAFGCSQVVDSWEPGRATRAPITDTTLVLTTASPEEIRHFLPRARIFAFSELPAQIGVAR